MRTRQKEVTIVDVLDRVLDKGLVIQADLIISVAGVPLIGVNLRAALAGMETMLDYGLLTDWEQPDLLKKEPALNEGEEVIFSERGSYYDPNELYKSWQYGQICLTNQRFLLYQSDFNRISHEIALDKLEKIQVQKRDGVNKNHQALGIQLDNGETIQVYSKDYLQLKESFDKLIPDHGAVAKVRQQLSD